MNVLSVHSVDLLFCLTSLSPRDVQSLPSMPWLTTYSASQQPAACMEPGTSPSQTTRPIRRLWRLCRKTRPWRLRRTEATPATLCHRPSPPQPSSCPSTMSTRHTDWEAETPATSSCLWLKMTSQQCLSHDIETSLEALEEFVANIKCTASDKMIPARISPGAKVTTLCS